eukprot:GHVS01075481.1.p1 GENE.GHVS01075481.1~~GHVS01075481.1.p1  ORF type:complete len:524 (+),score=93.73 GHVS01075481.1:226-1797(+)
MASSTCSLQPLSPTTCCFPPTVMSSMTVLLPPHTTTHLPLLRQPISLPHRTPLPSTVVVGRVRELVCVSLTGYYSDIHKALQLTHNNKTTTHTQLLLLDATTSEHTRWSISHLLETVEAYPTELSLLPLNEVSPCWCITAPLSSVLLNLNLLLDLLQTVPLSTIPPSPPSYTSTNFISVPPLSPPPLLSPTSTKCSSPETLVSFASSSRTTPRTFPLTLPLSPPPLNVPPHAAERVWQEFGPDGGPATTVSDSRPLQLLGVLPTACTRTVKDEVTLAGLGAFLNGCDQLKDEFCVIETTIPIQLARFLIGMRGGQVKRIQAITGATVNLSRSLDQSPSPNSRKLQITGSLRSVYAALAFSQSLLINRTSTAPPPLQQLTPVKLTPSGYLDIGLTGGFAGTGGVAREGEKPLVTMQPCNNVDGVTQKKQQQQQWQQRQQQWHQQRQQWQQQQWHQAGIRTGQTKCLRTEETELSSVRMPEPFVGLQAGKYMTTTDIAQATRDGGGLVCCEPNVAFVGVVGSHKT